MWVLRSRSLGSIKGRRLATLRPNISTPATFYRPFSTAATQVELEFNPQEITNLVVTEPWTHPKIEKSQDLLAKGTELLAQGRWDDAYPLLESAIELQEKFQANLQGCVASYIYQKLGFVYHRLGKFAQAEDSYVKALQNFTSLFGSNSRDVGATCLYLSELYATQNKMTEALKYVTDAVVILRHYHKDIFLGGALSNHATILCAMGDYEAALPLCTEALEYFLADIGKDSDYTRQEEIDALRKKWDEADQITETDVPGLTNTEIADIMEELAWSLKKAEPKWTPDGFTKGPTFVKKEMNQFLNLWTSRNNTFGVVQQKVLDQESKAFFHGLTARKVLAKELAAQRLAIIEQRMKRIDGVDAEFRKQLLHNKRLTKDAILYDREHKYTAKMLEMGGMDRDDLYTSRTEQFFIDDTREALKDVPPEDQSFDEGDELADLEFEVPIPSHMLAREVLWPLKFKDYENNPDLWRTEEPDIMDRETYEEMMLQQNNGEGEMTEEMIKAAKAEGLENDEDSIDEDDYQDLYRYDDDEADRPSSENDRNRSGSETSGGEEA